MFFLIQILKTQITHTPASYRYVLSKLLLTTLLAFLLSSNSLGVQPSFNDVQTWGYQLTGYDNGGFAEILKAPVDLIVIDLAKDGGDEYFTTKEIQALKNTEKIVLAYFEIGAIEDYRPEWDIVPKAVMAGPVDGWPKEQYVRYWDKRWWPVVESRLEQAISAGFDGAFLDLITAYDEIPDDSFSAEERARKMVALIVRITDFAKSKNSDFKVIAQNCPELANWSFWEPSKNQDYLNAIDGLALESPFYLAHDKLCNGEWCRENRENALFVKSQGKLLLGVDYAKQPQSIRDSYNRQREAGFVPYVSVRALDRMMVSDENISITSNQDLPSRETED